MSGGAPRLGNHVGVQPGARGAGHVLKDCTNAPADPQALKQTEKALFKPEDASPLVSYTRRPRAAQPKPGSLAVAAAAPGYEDREAAAEEEEVEEQKAAGRQARGRRARKAAQTQAEREAAILAEYMAQQSAYFAEVDAFQLSAASPCVEATTCPRPPQRASPATAATAADTAEVQVEWTAQVAEEDVNAGSFVCRVLGEEVMGPSPLSAAPPLALASLAEETEESPSPSCVEFPIARRLLLSPAALPTPVASPPPPQPAPSFPARDEDATPSDQQEAELPTPIKEQTEQQKAQSQAESSSMVSQVTPSGGAFRRRSSMGLSRRASAVYRPSMGRAGGRLSLLGAPSPEPTASLLQHPIVDSSLNTADEGGVWPSSRQSFGGPTDSAAMPSSSRLSLGLPKPHRASLGQRMSMGVGKRISLGGSKMLGNSNKRWSILDEVAPLPDAAVVEEAEEVEVEAADSLAVSSVAEEVEQEKDAFTQLITAQLEAVTLEEGDEEEVLEEEEPVEELTAMQAVIKECGQTEGSVPTLKQLLLDMGITEVVKIGEGTFGEAFKGNGMVLKIVPMGNEHLKVNGEAQKTPEEMYAEVVIAQRVSKLRESSADSQNLTDGFIHLRCAAVAVSEYAPSLLAAWNAWDKIHRSENETPKIFPAHQPYMVFITADGGCDLEHFQVRDFDEARSILLQTTVTLAVAEQECRFEHRDLHWGNVLISRPEPAAALTAVEREGEEDEEEEDTTGGKHMLRGVPVHIHNTGGVRVALIDFTLSRLDTAPGNVAYFNLAEDPGLFEGPKGYCQSETYRRMRVKTGDQWEGHHPGTNTLWLHYLADKMLTSKALPCSAAEKRSLTGFRRRALKCSSAAELFWDEFFTGAWTAGDK